MQKITLSKVKDFLVGNFKYYYDKYESYPEYIQEQLQYRYNLCKDDCIPRRGCIKCNCTPVKKHFLEQSCNPERFPNLMSKKDWEEFKQINNINGQELLSGEIDSSRDTK